MEKNIFEEKDRILYFFWTRRKTFDSVLKICILQVQQKILERKASSKFEPKFLGQLSKLRSEELSGAKALLKRGNIAGNRQISEEKSFFTEQMIFLVIYITPRNINSAKVIHVQKIVWKLIKTISCVGEEKYRHVIPSFALTELSSVNNKRKTSWSSRFASYKNQYKRFYKPTSPILEKNFPPIFIMCKKNHPLNSVCFFTFTCYLSYRTTGGRFLIWRIFITKL